MTRQGWVFLLLFVLFLLAASRPVAAGGAGTVDMAGEAGTFVDPQALAGKQLDVLETKALEGFLREFNEQTSPYLPALTRETIRDLIRGGEGGFSPANLIRGLMRYFLDEVLRGISLLVRLIVLAVLVMVLYNLQASLGSGGVARTAHAVVFLALVGLALASFYLAAQVGQEAVSSLVSFMQAVLPTLITLLLASGALITAGLFHPLVVSVVHLGSMLVSGWVFPLLFLAGILESLTGLSEQINLSGLARLFRQVGMVALGLCFSLFLGVISVFGAAGGVGDGTGLRAARFLAKNLIPGVGGMFADAADLVAGSTLLLRNGLGLLGMLVVILIVAMPIIKLLSLFFVFRMASASIQPLGETRVVSCLEGLAGSVGLMAISVGAVGVMFFMAIGALVGAGNVAVMLR